MKINGVSKVSGTIKVPSDKSITHRAIMLSCLAEGTSYVNEYLDSDDCMMTLDAFNLMGVKISRDAGRIVIDGAGLYGLKKPDRNIYAGNSGTTTRLLSGILAGQNFASTITGDDSLSKRPMKRIIDPLRLMNAEIKAHGDNFLPLTICGNGKLKAVDYASNVASAQVKSCVLLAGLYADGTTSVSEPEKSRDHSERMMKAYGADITVDGLKVSVKKAEKLYAREITVPSDISSAAFFIAAGVILKNSRITVKGVNINPTRDGIIEVLKNMGACVEILDRKNVSGEEVGDIEVSSSNLRGTNIDKTIMPRLIDEIPVLALCATQAEGTTVISGAKELRVKESDRLSAVAGQLNKMGADIKETDDGLIIRGKTKLTGCKVESFKDHRIAMMLSIAGLVAGGTTEIADSACVNISFSNFYEVLKSVCR